MPRTGRSDVEALLQEAKGMEMLATEAEVPTDRVQEYWNVSADLISLVLDIEGYLEQRPEATYAEPEMVNLRRRLRTIAARLSELTLE